MYIVMDTAKDRDNYIELFSNPFKESRIELGFQYYAQFFSLLQIPPSISIVITSVIIYLILYNVWFKFLKIDLLSSILLFNFIVFSLMNYYLGTSIRMGLASAIALFAFAKINESKYFYIILLFLSPFFHYGVLLFVVLLFWFTLTKTKSFKFHYICIIIFTIVFFSIFNLIVPLIGSSYYQSYFTSNLGQTERLFPFTLLFYTFSLVMILFGIRRDKLYQNNNFISSYKSLYFLSLYGSPVLLFSVISGIPVFGKMLMPSIFLSAILMVLLFYKASVSLVGKYSFFLFLFPLNILAFMYALKMYQFIL